MEKGEGSLEGEYHMLLPAIANGKRNRGRLLRKKAVDLLFWEDGPRKNIFLSRIGRLNTRNMWKSMERGGRGACAVNNGKQTPIKTLLVFKGEGEIGVPR